MKNKNKKFKKKALVPLPEFYCDELKRHAKFDYGIKLIRTSKNLIDTLPKYTRDTFWEHLSSHEKEKVKYCALWLINDYHDENLNFTPSIDQPEDEKVTLFLLCLWLVKSVGVTGELRFKIGEDRLNAFNRLIAKKYLHPFDSDMVYTNRDIKKLKKLWPKVFDLSQLYLKNPSQSMSLYNALAKVHDGLMAYNYDTRFVLFTIALESLLLHEGSELSYRFCNRAAWFLGSSNDERKFIFSNAKKIYNMRSKFVHGFLPTGPLNAQDLYLMQTLEKLCREILIKIFKTPNLLKMFTSGEKVIREYFDSLTLEVR